MAAETKNENIRGKLLIVDDDAVHTTLMEKVLLREGHQLAFAASGEEALNVARENPPELVLLDVKLPGMDGFTVCEEMLKIKGCAETAVIFVSGSDHSEDKVRGIKLGAMDFLSKPFDLKELNARIENVLTRARERRRSMRKLSEIRGELSAARKIQQELLPQIPPIVPGIQIAGRMQPASEVSGDYFDFIARPGGLGVCIGDVSGKGVPACLVMVMARLYLRHWPWTLSRPINALTGANEILHANTDPYQFMSMMLLTWDADLKRLLFCGAGHESLLVYRSKLKAVETVSGGGVVLGLRKSIKGILRQRELKLELGDAVLMYTDGLTEGLNPAGEMFGLERVSDAFEACAEKPADDIIAELFERFTAFGSGRALHDDTTIVVLKRTE